MKIFVKKAIVAFLYIGIVVATIACGTQMDRQITAESVTVEDSTARMTYTDEELGISFQVSREVYGAIICEIMPQEKDETTELQKMTASFYASIGENRIPIFHIVVYEGAFDLAYLKEKEATLEYIGTQKGYTYALFREEISEENSKEETKELREAIKADSKTLTIQVSGVEAGIFLDTQTEAGSGKTKIEYTKETISKEGVDEEVTIANVESYLGYQLKYEADSFAYSENNGKESYIGKNEDGDTYPNIFFTMEKEEIKTKEEVIVEQKEQSGENSTKKRVNIGQEEDTYIATRIAWQEGQTGTTLIKETYIVEANDNIYIIKLGYFKEAEEGYGSSLQDTLQSISFAI